MDVREAREVLGVGPGATPAEVRRAYRARALVLHPDAGGDAGAFVELARAYDELSGEAAARGAHARRAGGPPREGPPPPPEDASPMGWDEILAGLGGWPESPSFARAGGSEWAYSVTLRVSEREVERGFRKRVTVEVPGRPARVRVVVEGAPGRRPPYDVDFPAMGRPAGGGWDDLRVRVRLSRRGRGGAHGRV